MAVRAEHFPFSSNPVMRWLVLPSAGWTLFCAAAARLIGAAHRPVMGSMSSEWLRDHVAATRCDSWD
jgi:hypothetical protein